MRSMIDQLRVIVASGPIGAEEITRIQDIVGKCLPKLRAAGFHERHEGPGRYMLYKDQDLGFVIMMMVWSQGQKTPIHDHGTWGVEGVLQNTIAVTTYTRCENSPEEISQVILPEGSVTFVLPPDFDRHVVEHYAGEDAISIHVYGRELLSARCFVPGAGFQDLELSAKLLSIEV